MQYIYLHVLVSTEAPQWCGFFVLNSPEMQFKWLCLELKVRPSFLSQFVLFVSMLAAFVFCIKTKQHSWLPLPNVFAPFDEDIAKRCKIHFWWRVGWFFWTSHPLSLLPSSSLYLLITFASAFPSPHFRLLMLPRTCTVSTACPPPETQVQLSMVTRSVYGKLHINM